MNLAAALGFVAVLTLTGAASGQEVFSLSNTVNSSMSTRVTKKMPMH